MEGLCFYGFAGDTYGATGNVYGDSDCSTPPPTPGGNRMGGTGAIRKSPRGRSGVSHFLIPSPAMARKVT